MKHLKHIAAIALVAVFSVACTKEMDAPGEQSVSQITATWAESQTKTVLGENGTSVLWSPNDEISVFYNNAGVKFTSLNTDPVDQTIFASDTALIFGGTEGYIEDYLYGIYPYSSDNSQDCEYLTLTIPTSQTAVEGSFDRGAYPAVGRSKDTDIAFYNVCGGICFSVTNPGIKKVVFSGLNNENLAGKVKVAFDQNGKPAVTQTMIGETELVLTVPDGTLETGKMYYISSLPTILSSGFKMAFYTSSGHATLISFSAVEIKRSTFVNLKDADAGLDYEESDSISSLVDLGLSVKWASCNVGASSPEEYGRYFAWGDIVGQTWNSPEWSGGGFSAYPSYEMDVSGSLKTGYDAANINLGGSWRIPTKAEQQELIDNCTSTWTNDYNGTGVAGRVFTSKKDGYTDKSIFLPAAGYCRSSSRHYAGFFGFYWSSSFSGDLAWSLCFYSDGVGTYNDYRLNSRSVRPVTE